jgi:hypothetical protein
MSSYLIHDNRGRPFQVFIEDDGEVIIKTLKKKYKICLVRALSLITCEHAINAFGEIKPNDFTKVVKRYKNVERVFIGKDKINGRVNDGNSILLKLKGNRYATIFGSSIYEFSTSEPITRYLSPVGNNDVPYPVAFSKNYVYFMHGTKMDKKTLKSYDKHALTPDPELPFGLHDAEHYILQGGVKPDPLDNYTEIYEWSKEVPSPVPLGKNYVTMSKTIY